MELENLRVGFLDEAEAGVIDLTSQDSESGLAQRVEVVERFPLEVWNVEARRGLTPTEGDEAVTLPLTPSLG